MSRKLLSARRELGGNPLGPVTTSGPRQAANLCQNSIESSRGQVEFARVNYQKARAYGELDGSSVSWDGVTPEDCASLRGLLNSDPQEAEVHRFLEEHPKFLIQVLGGGHGRFQLSKPRFGAELVPDFLVSEMSSMGIEWHLVEIESPRRAVQRQDGLPTSGTESPHRSNPGLAPLANRQLGLR